MVNTKNKFAIEQSWRFIAILIAMLVFSLPFYSANAMATSVKVTSNHGEDGIEGYLDAEGDIWSLEVEIANDAETDVSPEQVLLNVAGSQIEFNSCSSTSLSTICEFQSVLSDGINEGTYSFEVIYYNLDVNPDDENITEIGEELASDTDSIIADGSEPSISFSSIYQEDGDLHLSFEVDDEPNSCVGLDQVEVVDAETGEVYETFTIGELEECSFDYGEDAGNAGIFTVDLEGEGARYFKIKATDLLGHEEITASKRFDTDFIAPSVDASSLLIADFGSYVSTYSQTSNVLINVTECTDLDTVTASSDFIEFGNKEAVCSLSAETECLHECTWTDLTVNPDGSSISATVTATDDAGNAESSSVSTSFTADSTGPDIVYFGTLSTFDGLSYVAAKQDATIHAFINDNGAGIDVDTVVANLVGVGGDSDDNPNECLIDSSGTADYVCYWDVDVDGSTSSTSTTEINIHDLEDNVGNDGDLISVPVVVDGVDPQVTGIEFYGFSAIGEKDYFQSNDDLLIELTVTESSGLTVYVDANELVMDAENEYQYGSFDDDGNYLASDLDGWVLFTETDCSRDEETTDWECEFRVDSIKSGPDGEVNFQVLVTDTAGNVADWSADDFDEPVNALATDLFDGEFEIELFGLDEETQPDFWEQGSISADQEFIDLDTVELTYTTMFFGVGLKNDVGAKAALIELDECVPSEENEDAPTLSRSLMYGGVFLEANNDPSLSLVLEFEPVNPNDIVDLTKLESDSFETIDFDYECNLHVYSVVGDTAMNFAESQTVTLTVPFGFSQNGAIDANVDALLFDAVDNVGLKIVSVGSAINKVTKWFQYASRVYSAIVGIINIFRITNAAMDIARKAKPYGDVYASAYCGAETGSEAALSRILDPLGTALEVISCNPSPKKVHKNAALAVYSNVQLQVLKYWKIAKGGYISEMLPDNVQFLNRDASSLYDNIIVSTIGLCIPGIAYNLDKYAQIECTYIKCLNEGVKEGITTVDVCSKTKSYMYCKHILGEVMQLFPIDVAQFVMEFIITLLKDPIGVIFSVAELACGAGFCAVPEGGKQKTWCSIVGWFFRITETIGNIYGVIVSYPSVQYNVCSEPAVKEVIDGVKEEAKAAKKNGGAKSVKSTDL